MELVTAHGNLIFWMLVSFSIVLFVLRKFAWKPILKALKDRENSIRDALTSADEAKKEMESLKADNEKIIIEAKKERDNLISEAKDIKESIISEAKKSASVEAHKITESAKQQIEAEKQSAIEDMKKQIAELSVQIAEKLLNQKLADDNQQEKLISNILKDIKLN